MDWKDWSGARGGWEEGGGGVEEVAESVNFRKGEDLSTGVEL